MKKIQHGQDARDLLMSGVEKIAEPVASTLGPRGRNVILYNRNSGSQSTNDGVTIARNIELPNEEEEAGARVIRDIAIKTNDDAGDGTTTATVLAYAIAKEGMPLIAAKINPVILKAGIDKAVEDVVEELDKFTVKVEDNEQVKQIATISSQDEKIGEVLADTFDKVGKDSVITIEDSATPGFSSSIVEGYQINAGYATHFLINDDKGSKCVLKDNSGVGQNLPYILVTDYEINNNADIVPIMKQVVESGHNNLCIIASSFGGEALQTLVVNHMQKKINVCLVRVPGIRERKTELLLDIAAMTGATMISNAFGKTLPAVKLGDLGVADKVEASRDGTILMGTKGDADDIAERRAQLEAQRDSTVQEYERELIIERLARMGQGIAVIYVGATTEFEQRVKKDKLEDALNAARASIEEGIIPGGGSTLAKISRILRTRWKESPSDDNEFNSGYRLVLDAIEYPLKRICENAGVKGEVILDRVQSGAANYGFDARKLEYCDMIENGIIDPVRVTKSAVKNAGSAAGTLLTTSAVVTNLPVTDASLPQA